eukprot:g24492.t1
MDVLVGMDQFGPKGLSPSVGLYDLVRPESWKIPDDWKIADVTPMFKKGGKQEAGNYRPISLTLVVGKILDSIRKDEIAEYLEVHGKVRLNQHDFIKEVSCLTNLIEFFEEIMSRLDKGEPVDVIYLDFQKVCR